ncbi:hypothetical protein KOR34_37240 [Posidoniimonas corsicana]|uniref:Uncharacterized protein n=1 Tax=Posidoniimonas corsicana TaxID=1938618 RepID=A0A5C5V5S6_9BACT|nr:hypothetical protein [Posidoniimonas corsicana]TWT33888.1 hypothetical protein KOR34_37240 [Posidoniimonas corsicana]
MVKVIKHGRAPLTVFEGVCRTCQSLLQEDRSKVNPTFDVREQTEVATVRCPVCKADAQLVPKSEGGPS